MKRVAFLFCVLLLTRAHAVTCNENEVFIPAQFGLPGEDGVCSPTTNDNYTPIDGATSCQNEISCAYYAQTFCANQQATCMSHPDAYYSYFLHSCTVGCLAAVGGNECARESNTCSYW